MAVVQAKTSRLDAGAGIVAIVLFLVGFFLPGAPPKADDSSQEVTKYLIDKRDELLCAFFLIALAAIFFIWFAAAVSRYLQASGDESGLPRAAFGGAVAGATLVAGGGAVIQGIVFEAAKAGDVTLNRALFDVGTDLIVVAGFGFGLFLLAGSLSGARTGALPGWTVALGEFAALATFLTLISPVVKSGFFANGGAFAVIAFLIGGLWILAVAILMFGGGRTAAAPPPAAP